MSETRDDQSSGDHLLDQILAEYIQSLDAGEQPDRQELIARHPMFAGELEEFFENRALFERAARPWVPLDPTERAAALTGSTRVTPGARLAYFGDYELLQEIARGGMGVVYKARQISLNRIVAVKMILAGQFASAADVQRFRIEAENAANLDHPNIVPIYEVGRYRGQYYFSMKLVDGGRLGQQIPRFTKDHRAVARLMATVARAVHYAHQRGILHRDLKPGNILLDAAGEPQITDFGLARRLTADSDLTLAGAILGTPCYMAPEQARSEKELSTAVDVYSLGAILYELLTGQPPFRGETALDTLHQVREQEPTPPSSFNPRMSRDVETICLTCLRKQSGERYGSAEALAEDLERWLGGEPIRAKQSSRLYRAVKWVARKPAVAALIAVSVIALVSLLGAAIAWPYSIRLQHALGAKQIALADAGRARESEKIQRAVAEESWRNTEQTLRREAAARAEADGLLKKSEAYFYAAHILAADREVQAHHKDRAIDLLDACREPMRRWEWYYLNRRCHDESQSFDVDPSGVSAIALSPDGKKAVAVTGIGTLRVLDLASGTVGPEIHSSHGAATCVAWQSGGEGWAVGDSEGGVSLWDVSSAVQAKRVRSHDGRVNCITFSVDGHQIASGGDDARLALWDPASAAPPEILPGHSSPIHCVCFSHDGRWIASGAGQPIVPGTFHAESVQYKGEAIVWELPSTEVTQQAGAASSPASARLAFRQWKDTQILCISFGPDDRSVVAGCADKMIRSWDVKGDRLLPDLRSQDDAVTALAYDTRTGRLFSSGGRRIQGDMKQTWSGHRREISSLAYDSTTGRAWSGSADGTVKCWLPAAPNIAARLLMPTANLARSAAALSTPGTDVQFTPDSQRLVLSSPGDLVFLSVTTGREVMRLNGVRVESRLRFDGTGRRLVISGKGGPRLYDALSGMLLRKFSASGTYGYYTVAVSGDGKRVAGSQRGNAFVWDADSGAELASFPLKTDVWDLAFSPDGRMLVTCGGEFQRGGVRGLLGGIPGDVTLWDVATGQAIRQFSGSRFCNWAVAFSPDGSTVAAGGGDWGGGQDGGFAVWDAATGRELLAQSHTECVFRIAYSHDGSRLAVSGGGNGWPRNKVAEVNIWDLASGVEMLSLKDSTGNTTGLTFSPDDRRFAAASSFGFYLWDGTGSALVAKGQEDN